jgi:DNA polymerase III subunit delta'
MNFEDIIGQKNIISHLKQGVLNGRIPHAQLFIGSEGCGCLAVAIAYAQEVLCNHPTISKVENSTGCMLKFEHFTHPDLHFIYPTVTTDDVKSKPKSIDFLNLWRQFLTQNPYGGLFDWYRILDVKNKQGEIRVDDANQILKTFALKSYEGGYKILIIWMAEKINVESSNKLLKMIEEPAENTLLILIAENEEDILPTIKSRCQTIYFNQISSSDISDALIFKHNVDENLAQKVSRQSQGNFNRALHLLKNESEEDFFEKWFIDWARAAFRAKGNPAVLLDLVSWSENVASLGRETQKKFLDYCLNMFREAMLLNYQLPEMVFFEPKDEKFKLINLAPFVHGNNINDIFTAISDAIYHIERNGNGKIVLTDLSMQLSRFIHKK